MSDHPRKDKLSDVDPLDGLLNDGVQPELDSDQLQRLSRHWNHITRRRRMAHTSFAAAILLVSVTAGVIWKNSVRSQPSGISTELAHQDSATDTGTDKQPQLRVGDDELLDGDPLEQLVIVAVLRKNRERAGQSRHRQDSQDHHSRRSLDELLTTAAQRIADNQDLDAFYQQHRAQLSEGYLSQAVFRSRDTESRLAALHLLNIVVTRRSVPLLLNLRAEPEFAGLAMKMLLRVADVRTLFQLARQESDSTTLRQICAMLLEKESESAVHLFLKLVDDQRTSAIAIAAIDDVANFPVNQMLNCLQSRKRNIRLTAGFVLGRSNNVAAVNGLMRCVQFNQTRRAALVGLLASNSDSARQFVGHARSNVYLAAPLHAAQTVFRSFPTES